MRRGACFAILATYLLVTHVEAFDWNVRRIDGRDYVRLEKIAEYYNLPQDVAPTNNTITLIRDERSFAVTKELREAQVNGVKYILSFPIIDRDGTYWVSRMDLAKTIEPAFHPDQVEGIKPFTLVVLDAGHGGHDNGARGPYEVEKNFALDVARRVRNELQNSGMKVFMTRNSDTFVELSDRAALANGKRNSIFVSIHFNAADWNRAATGLEIYSITPRGAPSTEYDEVLVRDMVNETGNQNETQSFVLASTIYHSLQGSSLNMFDRGVKRARFAVLRLTKMPAVLIEGGFLTNADDAKKVASTPWRNIYAKAIARGILEYAKLAEMHQAPRTVEQYRSGASAAKPVQATATPSPGGSSLNLRDLPSPSPQARGQ